MNPKNTNYRQVFAQKRINARLGASGEYTYQLGTHALREGLVVDTKEWRFVKKLHAEAYQRLNAVSFQDDGAGGRGVRRYGGMEAIYRGPGVCAD